MLMVVSQIKLKAQIRGMNPQGRQAGRNNLTGVYQYGWNCEWCEVFIDWWG